MARQGKARVLTLLEFKQAEKAALLTKHPLRNRAIVYLSFGLGFRACEIRRLRIKDVLSPEGALYEEINLEKRVKKGKKQRHAYLTNKKVCAILLDYIEELKQKHQKKRIPFCFENPLFMSQKGGEFLPNDMVRLICMFYKTAGLVGAKSHSGRRTLITKLIDEGYDLKAIADVVGRSSIKKTISYHQSNPTRLKKISEKSIF
jgi:integrase/recombinase XerD